MNFPLIGITGNSIADSAARPANYALGNSYVQAVLRAGGVPLIIPPALPAENRDAWLDCLLSGLDGIIFSGGADLDPALFDGASHTEVYGIDAQRDTLEIALIRRAAEVGKPFLGICRGIQSVNVAFGGSLYTHIPDQLPNPLRHDWYPNVARDYLAHEVQIEANSQLAHILGASSVQVNSLHHQGVMHLAAPLRPLAYAPDGLIEALELPDHPFGLAVQWHPEALPQYAPQRALFAAFVQAATQK